MIPERRCDIDALLRYVFGEPLPDERVAMEDHLRSCSECRNELPTLRDIAAHGSVATFGATDVAARRSVERLAEIPAKEMAVAQVAVAGLFTRPPHHWYATVLSNESMVTPAFVQCAITAAGRLLNVTPRATLPFYEFCAFVGDHLAQRHPAGMHELTFEAWKDYAFVLARTGEYERADFALDMAEYAARECADRKKMLAIVAMVRGIRLAEMQHHHEALPLVVEARDTFKLAGDEERYRKALEQEANIRMSIGEGAEAARILMSLASLPDDDAVRARRYRNLATAFESTGAVWSAGDYAARALELDRRLNATYSVHTDMWLLGRILARAGRIDEALETLHQAADGFRSGENVDDAIRVDLERAEIEIAHGVATPATYDRLRAVATYAIEKRLPVAKYKALAFLQQLGRSVTLSQLRYVKEFIAHFDDHPYRDFQPPELPA